MFPGLGPGDLWRPTFLVQAQRRLLFPILPVVHLTPAAMALVSINQLPENILLEVFTHVPARQLRNCRPCAASWRDLIDLVTSEAQVPAGGLRHRGPGPACVRLEGLYFLCSLRRNLLRNPCAEGEQGLLPSLS